MRSAGEQAKVARMLRRPRMMQKFRGITFHNSIDVMHTKLTLINKEPICRRVAFEKGDSSFDSPNPADERPDQKCDDAEMRDEKCKVMFAPWPARQRGAGKIRAEQDQPEIEPRRAINVGARNFRVET